MAERKEADDEFNPRHRIVGAVILVALAVIVLPMVLKEEPPQTGTVPVVDTPVAEPHPTGAPPADDAVPAVTARELPVAPTRSTRIVTVPVDPVTTAPRPERPRDVPAAKPAPAAPVTRTEPSRPAPAPAVSTGTKTAAATPATASSGGWIVQVGVFSQADNARRLQERLKAKGYAVTLDPPGAPKGKTVRVEVGPYRDQAAAKSAAARILRDFDINGIVRSQ